MRPSSFRKLRSLNLGLLPWTHLRCLTTRNAFDWLPAPIAKVLRFVGAGILWAGPLVVVAAIWEFITQTRWVSTAVLPSPAAVIAAGAELLRTGEVLPHLLVSLYRALAGLALGSSMGIVLGILMAYSTLLRELLDPFVTLTFPLPKTAFVPIALLWRGVGNASVILVVFLGTMTPMLISTYHGARSVHEHFVWSAQAMGASRVQVLRSILIPASLPYVMNGLRIGLAFSIVVVISAEMVAARAGIGQFIYLFGESGSYDYMFATIFIVVSVAFLLDRAFSLLSRRLLRWKDEDQGA